MLAEDGSCANGHPRSALRDVREGGVDRAPSSAPQAQGSGAGPQPVAGAAPPVEPHAATRVIAVLIVAVPAVLLVAAAFWSSYAASMGMGMSRGAAWWSSAGSVLLTGALVAVWVAKKRSRR